MTDYSALPDDMTITYLDMSRSPYIKARLLALVVKRGDERGAVYGVGTGDDYETARKQVIERYWKDATDGA
jgi:hypothetical protein